MVFTCCLIYLNFLNTITNVHEELEAGCGGGVREREREAILNVLRYVFNCYLFLFFLKNFQYTIFFQKKFVRWLPGGAGGKSDEGVGEGGGESVGESQSCDR